jgi:hypothetical protein
LAWLGSGMLGVALLMIYLVARHWGSLLPCLAHLGVAADERAGMGTALLYLTNILGSASGSILVGFVLMDRLGLMEIAGTLAVWGLACAVLLSAVTPLLRRAKHFRIGLAAGLAVVGPLALGAQFTNHMVVSPSPIAWDFGRWRRTLENYRIKAALSKQNAPISDDQILEFEQLQVHQSDRIRDAERLFAQRLLDLDAGNLGGGFIHVRIDERTDARGQRIAQIGDIGPLSRKIGRCRTERARGGGDRTDGGLGVRQHVGEAARRHLAFYLVKILCGRREGRKRRHRGCGGR